RPSNSYTVMLRPISVMPPSATTRRAPRASRGGGSNFGGVGTDAALPRALVTTGGRSRRGPGRSARFGFWWRGSAEAADRRHRIPAIAGRPWRTPDPPLRRSDPLPDARAGGRGAISGL